MHIAVVGCGMSGSILSYLLPEAGHNVDVFEINQTPKVVCACGMSSDLFRRTASICELEPDNYILWYGKEMIVKFSTREHALKVKNLCTFDKLKFESDLMRKSKACFHFGKILHPQKYSDFDLVIDATGVRACLGRLPSDRFYVCYQVKASFEHLPHPDYYMEFARLGEMYRWMFPLSSSTAYVGAGARDGPSARAAALEFMQHFNGKILEEKGKLLRLAPPDRSMPFHNGNVVGVGNSIGSITSLGEGIGPSIETAMLLSENLYDLDGYQKKVMKKLGWIRYDYRIFNYLSKNEKIRTAYSIFRCRRHYQESFSLSFKQILEAVVSVGRSKRSAR